MFMRSIKLRNILSFGPDEQELELKPLNLLIGPNGSGKSNLIEVFNLLRATPTDLTKPIIEGGGVRNWIWRGESSEPSARVEASFTYQPDVIKLRHSLAFAEQSHRLRVTEERIDTEAIHPAIADSLIHFTMQTVPGLLQPQATIYQGGLTPVPVEDFALEQSILAQRRDPVQYPALNALVDIYSRIRLYREWTFGQGAPTRTHQDAALPNDFLMEGGQNLGLMLNRLKREPKVKSRFLHKLRELYEGIEDFDVIVEAGTVQVSVHEGDIIVPAVRLSDGTLRYMALLSILCHPNPPPLICIEEPELGLHPDILPGLADLLREASERCQLIVTTHSDVLVDRFTDSPECVVTCEKHNGQTRLQRLDADDLKHWLSRYSLGDLWTRGGLGGNRW